MTLTLLLLGPITLYFTALAAWHIFRRILLANVVCINDFPLLRNGRQAQDKVRGTAVVCGGSIAGLLTARICHEHFERVLVIEAEEWAASEDARAVDGWKANMKHQRTRIMQFNSLHGNQPYIYAGLQVLFPNLAEECARSDIRIASHNPLFSLSGASWKLPFTSYKDGILPRTLLCARPGTEALLRRLILDKTIYPNIEYLAGTVTDVVPDPANASRLGKVVVRTRSGIQEVSAALVADCTGITRAGLKWLTRHGYGAPSEPLPKDKLPLDQIKISFDQKLRYSTIIFNLSQEFHDSLPLPDDLKPLRSIISFLEDPTEEVLKRGRAFLCVMRFDANMLVAFVGHYGTVRPQPRNAAEMKEYVRDLHVTIPIPEWIFELFDKLQEVEDTDATHSLVSVPPTTYVRYHLATNLPTNFIALGDSVMTVNPLFGEGSSKVMRCVMALHKTLFRAKDTSGTSLPESFSEDFFKEEHRRTDWLWENTRTMDYGALTTEPIAGDSLSRGAFARWYATQLQRLAVTDNHAGKVMYQSVVGFATPIDALHPHLLAKILWAGLRA
ncbi:hypothetical protein MIND_00377500 [Mycena indigotica]|uniref:FAD/NAD(P)-binding domain-containing protein n=1 Tax=Mycena indigotica TaxID=2126181 RepID=A0A8H6T5Z8_9AGAR|nr:uncharacterized protein MIND_00377500 [Mycena indigotica]KAF7310045.1 hypothetical protein MIND_00377500 [Mycena indigotica]